MKKEFISRKEYATIDAVKQNVIYYVGIFYNRKSPAQCAWVLKSGVIQTAKLQKNRLTGSQIEITGQKRSTVSNPSHGTG